MSENPGQRLLLATTFERALSLDQPALLSLIEMHWQADKTFAATVGDGEIRIWSPISD